MLASPKHLLTGCFRLVIWSLLAIALLGQNPAPAPSPLDVRQVARPRLDGDLSDWPATAQRIQLRAVGTVIAGGAAWTGPDDASLDLAVAYDVNCLYLAGTVRDDIELPGSAASVPAKGDAIELFLSFTPEERGMHADDLRLLLMPRNVARPWTVLDPKTGVAGQASAMLTGFELVTKPLDKGGYSFEAVLPFHQMPGLRPGARMLGLGVAVHDRDDDAGPASELATLGKDPLSQDAMVRLQFLGEGPLVGHAPSEQLLSRDLLSDLSYLLLPMLAVAGLLLLLRNWKRWQARARWLRPAVLGCGALMFLAGLFAPSLWLDLREGSQRDQLEVTLSRTGGLIEKLEAGTLSSYRGASRDRALMDLLAGKSIARQKYTSYRFLAQYAKAEFGAPVREYPDESFAVRPYWVPLEQGRAEVFHFDPPLRGEELYFVLGRPFTPFPSRIAKPQLQVELGYEDGTSRQEAVVFEGEFVSAEPLGRDLHEVDWRRVSLRGEVRTLSVMASAGNELRLVGLSLLPRRGEPAEPLFLGAASRGGVLTDLRGPYPLDAGIELGPGAVTKVAIPAAIQDATQKLWFFYRAVYPGIPSAIPGATVAEIVLNFGGGLPPRTLRLEHQVSMFYELALHNTRDQPPDGSPAAIAFSWVDESQERHINTVLPVTDLPANAQLESIEFRNLADYRIRFRSVVFGTEKAAAPQDPDDAPLVRDGLERRLREDVRTELSRASLAIYRDGRVTESTLPQDQRMDLMSLPRRAAEHASADSSLVSNLSSGARRIEAYVPLTGDGWDGAVLGVSLTDPDWDAARRFASRLGLLLCFCGSPLLLLLLSELLAAVANLRLRLMAVLSVASLAPLLVLSFVLAQVLERGHESDQQAGMQQAVTSAVRQLGEQMARVQRSAQQWLADLKRQHDSRLEGAPPDKIAELALQGLPSLRGFMAGQLPPEWRGGCLKLEWNPARNAAAPASVRGETAIAAGDERLAATETPARLEPGVYAQGGMIVIAVRAEAPARGGTMALTVTRPLDSDLLGSLAPGLSVLLCDTRGYPLDAGGTRFDADTLLAQARNPSVMGQRERDLVAVLDQHAPVVSRSPSPAGDLLSGVEVLRDLQETPRALLQLVQPDQRATLDLAIGRIPVRAFFFLVAGLLLVLSTFLAFVVSNRISRPVELLEHSTQSISRGEFGARVPEREGGQLGRLSRAFNQMATDLESRLLDLQKLNRALRDLSSQLDAGHTLTVLRRFCEQHCAVDRVRIAVIDPEAQQLEVHGGPEVERCETPPELQFLPRSQGPFCLWWPQGSEPVAGSVRGFAPSVRSVVGLPLLAGGRCCGAVLLLFETAVPPEIDLELLATVVSQAAVALEHALLYRHAVQDPVTGTFVGDYFRRRAAEEVAAAQQRGIALALLGLGLGDGSVRPRGLRRFAAVLRQHAPRNALIGHVGAGQFQLVVPGMDRPAAEACIGRMLEAWQVVVTQAPESEVEDRRPTTALAMFPEEAASAEFLFDVLRARLAAGSAMTPAAVETEVDASLQRAGITAVSPAMREVYRTLRRVAPTELAILLLGETGSGKEVLTNLTHRWSNRASGPLVKVHCAALSENLLASELFGHEKGAFTGADKRKIGKFEQANGGTIFLDEVGEIPLDVQVKLLRVLQEREVDRVGGLDPVPVDVRVVAATNRDLRAMVAAGKFREDLYYRLQGIEVQVPPLRERRQEIPALVEQFRSEVVASGQSRVRGFTTDAMDELFRRDWPGNIRELRSTVHRAMVLATGELVDRREVVAVLPVAAPAMQAVSSAPPSVPGSAPAPVSASVPPLPQPDAKSEPAAVVVLPTAAPAGAALASATATSSVAAADPLPVVESGSAEPLPPAVLAQDDRPGLAEPTTPWNPVSAAPPLVLTPLAPPAATAPAAAPTPGLASVWHSLPPRVQALYQRIVEAGSVGTQDHMAAAGVSHRTGLRDLQLLVEVGLIERVGTRRGARYRPVANIGPTISG